MKNLILILAVLLPLLSLSQNKVATISGKVCNGNIISATDHNVHFDTGVNLKLKSNNLEIASNIDFYTENGFVDTTKTVLSNFNKNSAGDYLQIAGNRYLTGIGVALAGGVFVVAAGYTSDNPDAFALAGVVMMITGGVISLTGHFQLIKAGKAMNGEAVTLSPSKEGIGFAINF